MLILLCKQDSGLVSELVTSLEDEQHQVDVAYSSSGALELAMHNDYDAIVLGCQLKGLDGFQLCRRLRSQGLDTPVMLISQTDGLDRTLEAFESGADDFLPLPFSHAELLARLVCRVRRSRNLTCQSTINVADLTINSEQSRVYRAGKSIELTPTCLKILEQLARESPRLVLRTRLEKLVWGDNLPDSSTLKAHIRNLRLAIDKPFKKPLIHTVRGRGYRLSCEDSSVPLTAAHQGV